MQPCHSTSDPERYHDGKRAPEAKSTPNFARGGVEEYEQQCSPVPPDLSKFDLTIGEAREAFQIENRRIPSARTLQRYCQDGQIECYKLKMTRNGIPVYDWIIDSTSLWKFIQCSPKDDTHFAKATPEPSGVAKINVETRSGGEQPARVATVPDQPGGTVKYPTSTKTSEREPQVTAPPVHADNAIGGQLSRAKLLIENARLTAQLDAQNELVSELRVDKRFMREEIERHRNNDRLFADLHRKTLQTLKTVAVAGRYCKLGFPRDRRPRQGRSRSRIGRLVS